MVGHAGYKHQASSSVGMEHKERHEIQLSANGFPSCLSIATLG